MTLTRKQHALRKEVSDLLSFLKFTTDLTGVDSSLRTSRLKFTQRELIVSAVLQQYLVMDEHLNNEMCWEFFPRRTYPELWKTKRFRAFNHHILDRLPLLQKLAFVFQTNSTSVLKSSTAFEMLSLTRSFQRIARRSPNGKEPISLPSKAIENSFMIRSKSRSSSLNAFINRNDSEGSAEQQSRFSNCSLNNTSW